MKCLLRTCLKRAGTILAAGILLLSNIPIYAEVVPTVVGVEAETPTIDKASVNEMSVVEEQTTAVNGIAMHASVQTESWDISKAGDDSVTATLRGDGTLYIDGEEGGIAKEYNVFSDTPWYGRTDITSVYVTDNVTFESPMSYFKSAYSYPSTELSLTSFYFHGNVQSMSSSLSVGSWIPNGVTSIDLGGNFDTSTVADFGYAFSGFSSLETLKLDIDTSYGKNFGGMFSSPIKHIELGDKFTVSGDMSNSVCGLFSGNTALEYLKLGDNFNCTSVKGPSFEGQSHLRYLDLGANFNGLNITDFSKMFQACGDPQEKLVLKLGDNFDTSSGTNFSDMFYQCNVETLDLGDKFDTSKATNMGYMFFQCPAKNILLGEYFDTSNVSDMTRIFASCSNLESIALGEKFDTSKITRFDGFFYSCSSLESLSLGDKFDTSNGTYFSQMFMNCNELKVLDLGPHFDVSSCTSINGWQLVQEDRSLHCIINAPFGYIMDYEYKLGDKQWHKFDKDTNTVSEEIFNVTSTDGFYVDVPLTLVTTDGHEFVNEGFRKVCYCGYHMDSQLVSIDADYIGESKAVGTIIDKNELIVKATYDNGYVRTLHNDEYNLNPMVISEEGINEITVLIPSEPEEAHVNIMGVTKQSPAASTPSKPASGPSNNNTSGSSSLAANTTPPAATSPAIKPEETAREDATTIHAPQTGDSNSVFWWIGGLLLGSVAIAGTLIAWTKERKAKTQEVH